MPTNDFCLTKTGLHLNTTPNLSLSEKQVSFLINQNSTENVGYSEITLPSNAYFNVRLKSAMVTYRISIFSSTGSATSSGNSPSSNSYPTAVLLSDLTSNAFLIFILALAQSSRFWFLLSVIHYWNKLSNFYLFRNSTSSKAPNRVSSWTYASNKLKPSIFNSSVQMTYCLPPVLLSLVSF